MGAGLTKDRGMSCFQFIQLPSRSRKPRTVGLTMVLEKGLGPDAARELAATAGAWIDVVKLGWGTSCVTPSAVVREKVAAYRAADIEVSNGGTLFELAHLKGEVDRFLKEMVGLGFSVCEISEGTVPIPRERIIDYIGQVREAGLTPVVEVGRKLPEEDLAAAEYARQLGACLKAGARYVIVEAREGGVGVGVFDQQGAPREDRLEAVLKDIPVDKVMFEAPRKAQQVYFIQRFGNEVNLGNISSEEAIALETLRRGLRGDTLRLFHGD